ncbi:MAG: CoA-binding protein [Deltaproteobacteria bacterium]|nr:CoA-binding protein [Deltaproteobacteria bacterium]
MLTEKIRHNLNALFNPLSVAVIGASGKRDKLGYHVMKSLTRGGFDGGIFPINPAAGKIMEIPAYKALADIDEPVDLAVIVVPAGVVPQVFEDCRKKGVKGIVLITAGFKEIEDSSGEARQSRLAAMAREAQIPVIGPNTYGMVNLRANLNASFTPEFSSVEKGAVALVSQSGGIAHLLAFMAMRQNVRMSKIIGLGNRLNMDFPEMIAYLAEDPDTNAIALYIEGQDDPRRLMAAAKRARGKKPIVALKVGGSETGDRASLAHTGSLAGKREVYYGGLRQAGIVGVHRTDDLLDLAQALSVCPLPKGRRMAVLTGQAGPGLAACDVCEAEGLSIPAFGAETQEGINDLLPPLALRTNPVDFGPAWYDSSAVRGIVRTVLADDRIDGLLLLMMFASANRETVPNLAELFLETRPEKPVITCFLAPPGIWDEAIARMQKTGAVVNLPAPERAARTMAGLWRYREMMDGRGAPID